MGKLFNRRILLIIPVIFLIVVILRISYAYNDTISREHNFAKKEAEVLTSYAVTYRNYYQNFFIHKVIPLNESTLPALPAFSSRPISRTFSRENPLSIMIKTVSDRARNIKNTADKDELRAIEFFKNNKEATTYFSDKNNKLYQYAYVLKIKQKCLKCHGLKKDAPKFIQEKYTKAYNYKLGEVRGIISIKVPKKNLHHYFLINFFQSVLYDILLLIALFFAIFYLIKKSKTINDFLGNEIELKTKEVKDLLIFDRLTKLPNRLKLIEDIQKHKTSDKKHLALINIDSFKDINDFYGHEVGDMVIKEIAYTIRNICTNEKSNIYKLPSDEYALFSTMDISKKEFFEIIKNIIETIQETKFNIDDHSIFITLSCGLASNEDLLLTKADIALQSSKQEQKNLVYYDATFDTKTKISENIKGMTLLKNAIKYNMIVPYFQPIYNVNTKKIEKYECLVRIILEDGEVIPPFKFLEIAIKSKLYPDITKEMIRKSFEFFKDKEYEFSINLSINDVVNKKTVKFIKDALENFDAPQRVVFEILESDKIGNYEELKRFIRKIKKYGCKFALDDFGSGYSNFAHTLELNIDYLKIDASLVKYITTDNNSRVITKTIINFASSLGLKTIAEFVEDKDSLEMLEKMGVDFVQGYYIGKPDSKLNSDFD